MFKKQQESETEGEVISELLQNGHVKRYQKGRVLGKGGFAECFEFISEETGKRYAAKVIDKETLAKGKAREKLQSEILIHKSLRHRHIVKFEHFFEDHQNVYILLQLCCNNTLNELLKRRKILSEAEVKFYMIQIINAVRHIHSKHIIHRDLKLGNFFLAEGLEVKVGDFGLATFTHEGERRKTICGTPNYIAPEILEGKKGHSYEVDVWSLGVIAFALLFGKPPFETNQVKTTYQKIKVCDYSFPKSNVSPTAKNFINGMLKLHPADRATIEQLLSHQFLNLTDIPRALPLSTLACPPSRAFLEQIKNDHRAPSESKISQNDQFQGVNTSRTDRNEKYQCLLASERFQSVRHHAKSRKSERSGGSITRTISTAAILTRKKINSNIAESGQRMGVTHWEQHPKYGVFYLLSNGTVGMRFNDITCLITTHTFKKFKYIALKSNVQEAEVEVFEAGQQREALSKKMKILTHFYRELKNKQPETVKGAHTAHGGLGIYVMAHFATTHYTLFWLSNSSFHAKFKDQTEIITEGEHLTYIGKDKKQQTIRNDRITSASEEVRSKYNHVATLIRKIKRNKLHQNDKEGKEGKEGKTVEKNQKAEKMEKGEKENQCLMQSSSSSKLIKPSKDLARRQFASTANLQLHKKPLSDYISNK